MGEVHSGINNDVGGTGWVTITEAATLLGVHPNTVRGRVKAGIYDAEKIATEHGLTWMIDPNVREELGAERVRREQAERERDELRTRLEALQAPEANVGNSKGAWPHPDTVAPPASAEGPEEALEATETGAEGAGEARHTPEARAEPQTGAQEPEEEEETARRPWWLRILGG